MSIEPRIALLDAILGEWETAIGSDFAGYRNHVYRVVHFGLGLHPCSADERERLIIAACFHDLGIWSDGTVDYLPPSIARATAYLQQRGRAGWTAEVAAMIEFHHQIRAHADRSRRLIEVFRQADLIDVSLGIVRFELTRDYVREIRAQFSNAGFHRRLVRLAVTGLATHPLNPLPFFKW